MFESYDRNYTCTDCGTAVNGVPPKVLPGACPECRGTLRHVGYATRQMVSTPTSELKVDPKSMVTSLGKRVRSAADQEKLYGKVIEDSRRRAKAMKHTGDKGTMRMVGRIPRELFAQKTRAHGKDYWYQGGDKKAQDNALRREGLLFE